MRLTRLPALTIAAALAAAAACQPKPAPAPAPANAPTAGQTPGARRAGAAGTRGEAPNAMRGGPDTTPPVGRGGPGAGEPNPRPWRQIVTPDAVTRRGLFTTHRIKSRLLFEIPRSALDKDMLLVTQIARTNLGNGYGGSQQGNRVIRWELRDNRILLRGISYEVVADTTLAVYRAVAESNYPPIIAAFNVEAYGRDSAAVIDVTRLYTAPPPEFAPRSVRGNPDAARSFVERVAPFPKNVEVEATLTVAPREAPQAATPGGIPGFFGGPVQGAISVLMHWSMYELPEQPMPPRLADSRVGYFSVRQEDFGRDAHKVVEREYITRYRLEKKDPTAAVSDPVKPIVYYVDPATPKKWVPWIKQGIEAWQPAFEAAGFSHAIIAKEAPSPAEDPDWSPEDARYSVIRWLPSTIENSVGPNVHDPRSGEIIEADVQFYQNVMNLLRDWYFLQVGPLDPRAKHLPLPDSLMGRLMAYVVTHEVGHTLGFPHNMKSSSTYPADSVRSRTWVHRMGHTPSLMDYARMNYVAQPEDSIALEDLIPRVGPYDIWATKWGYTPIPGAKSPDAELPTLDSWARAQDDTPWYRFSAAHADGADPGEETEAVGDADAVKSTGYGLRNIRRLVPMLQPAVEKPGDDYADLDELYTRLIGQWTTELNHVVQVVGGAESQEKHMGQPGALYHPLPRARQADAVRFLNANAFATPAYFLDTSITRRFEAEGIIERIDRAQARLLAGLLNNDRMDRLIEYQATAARPGDAYGLDDMLGDLRRGIWSELAAGDVRIDAVRRALQRRYLEQMAAKLASPGTERPVFGRGGGGGGRGNAAPPARPWTDARAMVRGDLVDLDAAIRAALPRAHDRLTRLHLEDARAVIDEALHPKRP